MANKTISQLTEVTAPDQSDYFVVWDSSAGQTIKLKAENLDQIIYRTSRANTPVAASKVIPVTDSAGVTEGITFEDFNSKLVIKTANIEANAITHTQLAANIRESPWVEKIAGYQAAAYDRILADTSAAAFAITLPKTPVVYDWLIISDVSRTWDTKNLTVKRDVKTTLINGLAEDLVCDVTAELIFRYEGKADGWRVYAYGY